MIDKYTLVGKCAVPCFNLLKWGIWMEENQNRRHVGDDHLAGEVDGTLVTVRISTVFLGIDHNFFDQGDPQIFETMVFGGAHNGDQWRYATWDEAETGHARTLMRERLWLSGLQQIQM